jgi:signal transduction histidine kinase
MEDKGSNVIFIRQNNLIFYFVATFCCATALIDLIAQRQSGGYLNFPTITSISFIIIIFLLLLSHSMSLETKYGITLYAILIYCLYYTSINLNNKTLTDNILRNTAISIILIPITGLLIPKIHILIFNGLLTAYYLFTALMLKIGLIYDNLPTLVLFNLLFAAYSYFSINILKSNFLKHARISNKVTMENLELSQQANTLSEINKLLSLQTSEIRIQQKELQKLNSTKDKFLSLFAHDLKTPINSIIGFTELLELKYDSLSDSKKLKYIQVINSSAQTTYNLLENLLEWSMSQSNNIAYNPQDLDLNNIVDEVFNLLNPVAERKEIRLIKNNINNLHIKADKYMLTTVIRNLVTNAIKYSKAHSSIIISATQDQSKASISIKDKGVGMTESQVKSLFRIESTKSTIGTRGEKGTGLGLLICHDFIQKHNSKMKVSSSPNEGTTFSFDIQLAPNLN